MRPANCVPCPQERRVLRVLLAVAPLTAATLGRAVQLNPAHIYTLTSNLFRSRLVQRVSAPMLQVHRSHGRVKQALVPAPIAALLIYRKPTPLRPQAHLIALSELVDGTFRDADALMLNRPQTTAQTLAGAA